MEHGKPEEGDVFNMMKQTKRQYFYAARRAIRNERNARFNHMAKAAADDKSRDFWKEVKKMSKSRVMPVHVNGETKNCDIAEVFRKKYQDLLNQVPSDQEKIAEIEDFITDNIAHCDIHECIVTEEEVTKAVSSLKNGKSDGNKGVISDHVKMAPKRFMTLLGLLLTTVQKHGYMPDDLLISTLSSITKDKCGNMCDSDNYRGICLSSCLAKIHDLIILNRYRKELSTSEMQYAFKENHGASMCTLTLKETVQYYRRNGSEVYVTQVDASKAFDRVRHDMLFKLLIDRKLPVYVIRCLYDAYKRQKLRTAWNGSLSQSFETVNGIKQGSVISPVLFTVYMDELLIRLQECGYGCYIGKFYFGAMSSADDLIIVSNTVWLTANDYCV